MGRAVSQQAKMLASAAGKAGARKVVVPVETVVVNGRTLTRDQALTLQRAAELASGGVQQRHRAQALVREVERELAYAGEVERVAAGVAETVALRGGKTAGLVVEDAVDVRFVRGADGGLCRHDGDLVVRSEPVRRVRREDGLLNLFKSGALNEADYATGQLYRLIQAQSVASARSSLCERTGGGATGNDAAILRGLEQAYAMLRLRLVRTALCDDRAFALLDAVAGDGATVRSVLGAGRAAVNGAAVLVSALRVAGPLLRVSDGQLKKGLAKRER